MAKKWCLAHKNCHDGLAGAWVAKKFNPDIEIFFTGHDHEWMDLLDTNRFSPEDMVYFIDFCPNPLDAIKLNEHNIPFLVLDHHVTSMEAMVKYDEKNKTYLMSHCHFDMNKAGCIVAWDYFSKTPVDRVPLLLQYVAIADTWTWRNENDHKVVQYIRTTLSQDATVDDFNTLLTCFDEQKAIQIGEYILKKMELETQYTSKKACVLNFDGIEVAAVNASQHHSEIGHELGLKSPSGIGMTYTIFPERGNVKFSVRGSGSGALALKYNGGGHDKAAGFQMKMDMFNNYLKTARILS